MSSIAVEPFSVPHSEETIICCFYLANESLSTQNHCSLWIDAHDWNKFIRLAKCSYSGNETRNFNILRSRKPNITYFTSIRCVEFVRILFLIQLISSFILNLFC